MCEGCSHEAMNNNEGIDLHLMDPIIEKYGEAKGSLINMLQDTQDLYGYLPQSAMAYLADKTSNKKATIYGVATFYTQFRLNPIGKYLVLQCQGTACHVNGSKEVSQAICNHLGIQPGETTEDLLFTVEDVACLGCCSLAPVIMINGEAYGNLDTKKAVNIIKELQKKEAEVGNNEN